MRWVLLLVALVMVAGCYWDKPVFYRKTGATADEFEQTKAHCWNQGYAIGGSGRPASVGEVAHNCMIANGWQLVQ